MRKRIRHQLQHALEPFVTLPAAALREVLQQGYGKAEFKRDLLAGLVVGVVALPLAMALSIAVGTPPQHGLYTAIIAGFITAALGGSRMQVSGPTAAFIAILAPIQAQYGLQGLLICGALGGIQLVIMGAMRLGTWIQFIPHPVTTGFTAGIGTVIASLQLKDLLGLHFTHPVTHFVEIIQSVIGQLAHIAPAEAALGISTLILLIFVPKMGGIARKIPVPLLILPPATIAAYLINRYLGADAVATISSRFSYTVGDTIQHGIPQMPPLPMWPWQATGPAGAAPEFSLHLIRQLLPSSFAVAMLAAIESLLSAVVADGMSGTRSNPDAELFAIGVGNIIAPFFGGIPATGAIARTATNVRAGAHSPVAAMIHAAVVLAAVLILAPIIGYVPMTALAALLLITAWNMSHVQHFIHIVRVAPKNDVAVLLTCFGLTVIFDMVIAVSVGVVLAALMFMRRMAELTEVKATPTEQFAKDYESTAEVAIYDIAGPLFFGAAERAMSTLNTVKSSAKIVILQMEHVPTIDATGLVALESTLNRIKQQGRIAILSGLRTTTKKILEHAELHPIEGSLYFCNSSVDAIQTAQALLLQHRS